MKILITGSTGFVGSALLKRIENEKGEYEISLLSSRNNDRYNTYLYTRNGTNYELNLHDDFDVLVHIGAWIPKSVKDFQNIDKGFGNIQFTKTLIESLPSLKRVVFISTIDVYAPTSHKITEKTLVSPISIYGYSKLYCEEMVKAWAEQHDVQCCILRLGHIYGAGEVAYKKLIPVLIQQALKGETVNVFSSGDELRSFLNIEDCTNVIWQAALGQMQGLFNVASGYALSVKDIAYKIKHLTDSDSKIVIQNQPIETRDMVFDNTHLKETFMIDEKPLEQGLKEEIEYFKQLKA